MNSLDRAILVLLWDGLRDFLNRWRDDDAAFRAFAQDLQPVEIKLPKGYVAQLRILSLDEVVQTESDRLDDEWSEFPFGMT